MPASKDKLWAEMKLALNWLPNQQYPGDFRNTYELAAAITDYEKTQEQAKQDTEKLLGYKP